MYGKSTDDHFEPRFCFTSSTIQESLTSTLYSKQVDGEQCNSQEEDPKFWGWRTTEPLIFGIQRCIYISKKENRIVPDTCIQLLNRYIDAIALTYTDHPCYTSKCLIF